MVQTCMITKCKESRGSLIRLSIWRFARIMSESKRLRHIRICLVTSSSQAEATYVYVDRSFIARSDIPDVGKRCSTVLLGGFSDASTFML